ncbi:MAG: hypothetical protein ACTHNU_07270 [Gaiellales bacterium]
MRRFWIGLAAGLALTAALPPAAQAKGELTAARVCGQNGCVAITGKADLHALSRAIFRSEQNPARTVPPLQGYFRLRTKPSWAVASGLAFFIPRPAMVETSGHWARPNPRLAAALSRLSAGLEPLQPAPLRVIAHGTTVGGDAVVRALLGGHLQRVTPPAGVWSSLVMVVITSRPYSPWTDQWTAVPATYAPRFGLVELGYGVHWYRLPPALNRHMRTALGYHTAAAASSSADGGPPAALLAAAAGLVVALAVFSVSRRRRHGGPASA